MVNGQNLPIDLLSNFSRQMYEARSEGSSVSYGAIHKSFARILSLENGYIYFTFLEKYAQDFFNPIGWELSTRSVLSSHYTKLSKCWNFFLIVNDL